jgi:hypothetical protein
MKSIRTFAIALIVVAVGTGTSFATIPEGAPGDGKTSYAYDPATGGFTIQADGQSVGLYDLQSASGIFTANANVPPGGLGLDVNTASRKSWAALQPAALTTDWNLGVIAATGLTKAFLLEDLSGQVSGGFGTPNRPADLVVLGGVEPVAPVAVDAPGLSGTAGTMFTHQFTTSAGDPPITWENLTLVPGGPTPPNAATLSDTGLFSWNAAQAGVGTYSWDVTARNAAGTDVGRVSINVIIPEPATISLIGLAMIGLAGIFRRHR